MITSRWIRPGEDATEALAIRKRVFEEELGLPEKWNLDGKDAYALQLVLLQDDVPVATGRICYDSVGTVLLDRICVLKKYRRQGIGDGLVKVLDYKAALMNMKFSAVETVPTLEPFYKRIGYRTEGAPFTRDGMTLVRMKKETNDGTGENCAHQCAKS